MPWKCLCSITQLCCLNINRSKSKDFCMHGEVPKLIIILLSNFHTIIAHIFDFQDFVLCLCYLVLCVMGIYMYTGAKCLIKGWKMIIKIKCTPLMRLHLVLHITRRISFEYDGGYCTLWKVKN